jgi:hypothetical protein
MTEPTKKVLSAEKLKQLEIARAKANQVRKANADLKEKEKALKVIEHQKRVDDVETKLKSLKIPNERIVAEEPPTPKREKKKKIVYVDDSSSDDDIVYVKRKSKSAPPPEPPEEQMLEPEHHMSQAQIKNEMARMRREMARKMMFRAY